MYLEFRLPMGAGGMAAAMVSGELRKKLVAWGTHFDVPYKTKIHKYTLRVTFDDDRYYSFFLASWDNEGESWFKPELKDPMNLDKTED